MLARAPTSGASLTVVTMRTENADTAWMRFMLRVAQKTGVAIPYKRIVAELLDVQVGETIVDIGCGLGDDISTLAAATGDGGLAVGIDLRPPDLWLSEAGASRFVVGDGVAIPFRDGCVDAVRVDRVLHLHSDPGAVAREIGRVLRPAGRVVIAEPDNASLAFPGLDDPVTRAVIRARACGAFGCDAGLGATLRALVAAAGLDVREERDAETAFTDFDMFSLFFQLGGLLTRVIAEGEVTAEQVAVWAASREQDAANGLFRARFVGSILLAVRPS